MKSYARNSKKHWKIITDIVMKRSPNERGKCMRNEIYPIMTEDGKMFCKCRNDGTTVELIGKNCSMSIQELVSKAANPKMAQQHRFKSPKNRASK